MEDREILTLFFRRSETALVETEKKYHRLCAGVAGGILPDRRDIEECLSDTWLRAWNAIPPETPEKLSAWLARVTRNLAVSRLRSNLSQKRGGGELPLILEELEECIAGSGDPQRAVEAGELSEAVNRFLSALPKEERDLFTARYFLAASPETLSAATGLTAGQIRGSLYRTRKKLKRNLKEEGLC